MARDSSAMLGELRATVDPPEKVCSRLGHLAPTWHNKVVDGVHHAGEDDRRDGATGTVTAAAEVETAAGPSTQPPAP